MQNHLASELRPIATIGKATFLDSRLPGWGNSLQCQGVTCRIRSKTVIRGRAVPGRVLVLSTWGLCLPELQHPPFILQVTSGIPDRDLGSLVPSFWFIPFWFHVPYVDWGPTHLAGRPNRAEWLSQCDPRQSAWLRIPHFPALIIRLQAIYLSSLCLNFLKRKIGIMIIVPTSEACLWGLMSYYRERA